MATKKTAKKTADEQPIQPEQAAAEAPAPTATKERRSTRRTRERSAAEAEEKLGAREAREDATGAKQGATKGAKRRKQETASEPVEEQPRVQLPAEPTSEPTAKKKTSRKRAKLAPAADDAPWNPTVALRWDDEEQLAWTGTLDELIEANAQGEESVEWEGELRTALREHGAHRGGGGAAPAYTVSLLQEEGTPEPASTRTPEEIHAQAVAALPKPPDTRSANVTSATLLDAAQGFIAQIEAEGASESTTSGYRRELAVALEHFGESTLLCSLTPRKVQNYFESDRVMVARNGAPKAEPSWQRTRRVLRLALVWAQEQKLIEEAPLPAKAPRKSKESAATAS